MAQRYVPNVFFNRMRAYSPFGLLVLQIVLAPSPTLALVFVCCPSWLC